MTFPKRPSYKRGNEGPPAIVIFLVGVALVFGAYYVWLGIQNFLRTGGLGVTEATERADIVSTVTAQNLPATEVITVVPTLTPIPPCEQFVVIVPNARVREQPSDTAAIITSFFENDPVCVVGRPSPDSEWYTIDQRPETRRLEVAYMHESVIAPLNPTPTPTDSPTPLPTVTFAPTATITPTVPPRPTETRIPGITDTPTPTLSPTPTQPRQSA